MKKLGIAFFLVLQGLFITAQDTELTLRDSLLYKGNYLYSGILTKTSNQKIHNYSITRGKLEGVYTSLSLDSQLLEVGSYKNNQKHGHWFQYNKSGKIVVKAFYVNGVKEGTWEIFDINGKLKYSIHYKDGQRVKVFMN